jgi:hypothetical protein
MKHLLTSLLLLSFCSSATAQSSPPSGYTWTENSSNGHYYAFTDVKSWADAQSEAVVVGCNLVTIRNQSEHDWLFSTFVSQVTETGVHIGINDINVEGTWEWISGEPVTFTNWYPGEPNDSYGGEDEGLIFSNNSINVTPGEWNDGNASQFRGIIEWRPTTVYVDQSGNGDYTDIQSAIDGSINGDTVIVRDGTYVENIILNGKSITMQSENGPATTIVDGNDSGAVVELISSDSTLDGFTFMNGMAILGGGVQCTYSSTLLMNNCTITENVCTGGNNWGGGMQCRDDSVATVTNCTFLSNTADYGGGVHVSGNASMTMTDCTIDDCHAVFDGGGLYSEPGILNLSLDNCMFMNNTSNRHGGGMAYTNSTPVLSNCAFTNNTAIGDGGGMWCTNNSSTTLANCTFTSNTTDWYGGGFYVNGSHSSIVACTFEENEAGNDGGGVYSVNSSAEVVNCLFDANSSSVYAGGFMANNFSNTGLGVLIESSVFRENVAQYGGAMHINKSTATVIHDNLFYSNHANVHPNTSDGGGIHLGWNVNPATISANTFHGNTATRYGEAILLDTQTHADIRDCIVWGSPSGMNQIDWLSGSSITVTYSDIEGAFPGTGNIDADPLFRDAANGDYSLSAGSPCLDAGDPNSPLDPDGTRADMGYYALPHADTDSDGLTDYNELAYGTDPLDQDTDDDSLSDGEEVYSFFTDPLSLDTDNDGIQDGTEVGNDQWWFGEPWNGISGTDTSINIPDTDPSTTTNPLDDDTDNDGLMDGQEDANHDGQFLGIELDPNDFDGDNDGLGDGLELGLAVPNGNDTDMTVFVADADPSTTTRATFRDTDGGGIHDGLEDANRNGMIDVGEIDPRDSSDDSVYLKHNGASVGGQTTLNFYACEPGSWMFLCYSLAGAGPTAFTNVTLDLTQPIGTFSSIRIDSNGNGKVGPLPVPASVSVGDQAWFQGVQVSIFGTSTVLTTTNMTPLTIQ